MRLSVLAVFVGTLSSQVMACASEPTMAAPKRPTATYDAHATSLIDDAIEPQAVGLALERPRDPKTDPILRARTEHADAVCRVRITTVTTRQNQTGTVYEIGFRIVDQITGSHPQPAEIVVELSPSAPAIAMVKQFESRLVTMNLTFLAFVRGYAREGNDGADASTETHFHLSPDTKEVLSAVINAAALAELK